MFDNNDNDVDVNVDDDNSPFVWACTCECECECPFNLYFVCITLILSLLIVGCSIALFVRTSFNQQFCCSHGCLKCHFVSNQRRRAIKWYLCVLLKRCVFYILHVCERAYFDTHYKTLTAGKVGEKKRYNGGWDDVSEEITVKTSMYTRCDLLKTWSNINFGKQFDTHMYTRVQNIKGCKFMQKNTYLQLKCWNKSQTAYAHIRLNTIYEWAKSAT